MAATAIHTTSMDGKPMKNQSELVRALRKELAAKEKELADQKWVFEQFLKSPSWRWTAPIRWAANQLRSLGNGKTEPAASVPDIPEPTGEIDSFSDPGSELKAAFTALSRVGLESFLASGVTL